MGSHFTRFSRYLPYIVIVLGLACAYCPVAMGYYLYVDDYFSFSSSVSKQLMFTMIPGRPMIGLWVILWKLVPNLAWMNLFRAISVANICLAACLLSRWLRFHKFDRWFSTFLSMAVFTLPAFQVHSANTICAVCAIAVTLSMLGVFFAHRSWPMTILFVILSCATYQLGAFFYLALLLVPLLVERTPGSLKFWHTMFVRIFLFVVAVGIYYFLWIGWLSLEKVPQVLKYDGRHFVTDFAQRWEWFMTRPMVDSANFWNLRPWQGAVVVYLGLLGVIFLYRFIKDILTLDPAISPFKAIRFNLFKYVGLFLIIPISYFVALVCPSPPDGYRGYLVLSSTMLLLMVLSLVVSQTRKYRIIFRSLTLLLMIVGAWSTNFNVKNYFVIPSSKEMRYAINSLRQSIKAQPDFEGVVLTMPKEPPSFFNLEFGLQNTKNGMNIRGFVNVALHELGIKKKVRVFYSYKGVVITLPGIVSNGKTIILADIPSYVGDITSHIKEKIVQGDKVTLLTDIAPWYEPDEDLKGKRMLLDAPMMFPQPKTIALDMNEMRD